mmetsp:Transcript_48506/g.56695  ORF Transcript_48506/g.56695 Transcript_48506/m.56695 type:complete len:258 (+) Transcript_48506:35-808(+)
MKMIICSRSSQLLSLLTLVLPCHITSFSGVQSTSLHQSRCNNALNFPRNDKRSMLHVMKAKIDGNKTGGGFGSVAPSRSSKARSVSGNAGSGAKPLRIAANTFDEISKKYGQPCVNDVYVRSPKNDKQLCWFVGKVARRLDETVGTSLPTVEEAILSQKRLILEYAKQLRPQNLGGAFAKNLELWYGPGNSELEVVQNKVSLVGVKRATVDVSDSFSVADVGYNPEIYVGDEINGGGLRVKRDSEGNPLKPAFEINQ